MKAVCVDASLVFKWLLAEEGSDVACRLLRQWQEEGAVLIGPSLLDYEVASVLRGKVFRGLLQEADLFPAFDLYRRLDLQLFHVTPLVPQGVAVAATLEQPTSYDVGYVLVAKQQETDLVTADEAFFRKASPLFPCVRFYRDLAPNLA